MSDSTDAADDPARQSLADFLQRLRVRAGQPSLRTIAQRTVERRETERLAPTISRQTVADVLAGRRTPRWDSLLAIAGALGETDPDRLKPLWTRAVEQDSERRVRHTQRRGAASSEAAKELEAPQDDTRHAPVGEPARSLLDLTAGEGLTTYFTPGSVMTRQGNPAGVAFVMIDGYAKVVVNREDGYEVLLDVRGPGDLVGVTSVISGSPFSAMVVTLTEVRCAALPAARLRESIGSDPELGRAILRVLTDRLRRSNERRVAFQMASPGVQVARALTSLYDRFPPPLDDGILPVNMSQNELASFTGMSLRSAAKGLGELAAMDLIQRYYRGIRIVDKQRLREFADLGD